MVKYKAELDADVEGLGDIYSVYAPFDKALKAIKKEKTKIITLEDLAYSRIKKGNESSLCTEGSFVKEAAIFEVSKVEPPPIFVSDSPILKLAKEATEIYKTSGNEVEFYLTEYDLEVCLRKTKKEMKKEPRERNMFQFERNHLRSEKGNSHWDVYYIPTNRFGDEEITLWAFKKYAKDYGDFLRSNGIEEMPIITAAIYYEAKGPYGINFGTRCDKKHLPFARQLWLADISPTNASALIAGAKVFDGSHKVCGVAHTK